MIYHSSSFVQMYMCVYVSFGDMLIWSTKAIMKVFIDCGVVRAAVSVLVFEQSLFSVFSSQLMCFNVSPIPLHLTYLSFLFSGDSL